MWRRSTTLLVGLSAIASVAGIANFVDTAPESQSSQLQAATTEDPAALPGLVSQALDTDPTIADPAIPKLRALGQPAVDYLILHTELRNSPRWKTVLDSVALQRDAEYSGLCWHTDLDVAKAIAKRDKKPILSLRLLGRLTDELSCANSRFFRTALYPNATVRDVLKNDFVLHWQTVREVPIITIDFGDGRQIKRTVTGNSLHLVLDHQGRAVDILPGLYVADMFLQELKASGPVAVRLGELNDTAYQTACVDYHQARLAAMRAQLTELCQKANLPEPLPVGVDHSANIWTQLSLTYMTQPVLDQQAAQAVAANAPPAEVAGLRAMSKAVTETPAMRLLRNVSRIMREDSTRNQYYLHAEIHKWFAPSPEAFVQSTRAAVTASGQFGGAAGSAGGFGGVPGGVGPRMPTPASTMDRESLVKRVYSQLFLSPVDDPWYGLSKPDVYSAVKNDGRIDVVTQDTRD